MATAQPGRSRTLLGFFEAAWCLFEYLFLIILTWFIWSLLRSQNVLPKDQTEPLKPFDFSGSKSVPDLVADLARYIFINAAHNIHNVALGFGIGAIETGLVISLLLLRYKSLLSVNRPLLPNFLGVHRFRLSKTALFLMSFHVFGFFLALVLQSVTNRWVFSMDNFLNEETGGIEHFKLFQLLFFIPIKEEIVFRGIIFTILNNRISSVRFSAVVCNLCFGLFHLINLLKSSAPAYVAFQIALGMEIGIVYSMRYVLSGTIWECLILHITNNLASGFVSSKNDNIHNPSVQLSVILTVVVYFIVLALNWNKLKEKERVEGSKKTA